MKIRICRSNTRFARLCAVLLPIASLALGSSSARAQDFYTGNGPNDNFSNKFNWAGNVAPVDGDALVFGNSQAAQVTANNNHFLSTADSISFVNPNAGSAQSFTLTGAGPGNANTFELTAVAGTQSAISNTSSADQFVSFGQGGIVLNGVNQQFSTGDNSLTVSSKITLNGTNLLLTTGAGTITLSGNISGDGAPGEPALSIGDASHVSNVILSGNNSGMSSVTLVNGNLTLENNKALGTDNLIVFGQSNVSQTISTIQSQTFANGIVAANNFTFAPTGAVEFKGGLALATSTIIISNSSGMSTGTVQINGGISTTVAYTSGSIVFSGAGNSSDLSEFILGGGTASTYNSGMGVEVSNNALLDLNVNPAHGAITGNLYIDAGSEAAIEQNFQLATTSTVTVQGLFVLNGHQETIDDLESTVISNVAGEVDIGAGGRLTINQGNFSGLISDGSLPAGGELDKEGAGTFTLSGTSTYSGKTIINGGTFAAGADFALDPNSRYVVNSGGILALQNHSNTIGELADNGTGGIVENGGGNAAILSVGDDIKNSTFHGTIEDGSGSAALGLIKTGSDTLILAGDNSYSGGTNIQDGKLAVASATALGTGDVFVSGGLLRVAGKNGPTAINVGGNFVETTGTLRLAIYLNVSNSSDSLVVDGSANLGPNSTLKLGFPLGGGTPSAGLSYDLVHTNTGTVTGMFGTVTGLNNFTLDPGTFATLVYTSNDVTLAFRQFLATIPGLTPNQTTIANVLDRLEGLNTSGQFGTVVNGLYNQNASGLGGALDQLSPEQFAKFTSVTAFNNASFETQAMDNYLNGQRGGANGTFIGGNGTLDSSGLVINDPSYDPSLAMVHSRLLAWNAAPYANGLLSDSSEPLFGGVEMTDRKDMKQMAPVYDNPWNFFVRGNVILAQGFSQQDVGHFDDNTESVVLGTDYRITPNFLVGLTAGYAHTDVTLDNNGSSATVDSYSPGIYAAFANKGWYANFNGSYTHNAYTESRSIAFLGQTANGAPEGNEGVVNLDGGYEFHKGAFTFGPLAGLQYTHLTVDGYNESGSDANLGVNEDQSDSLRSRLGGRVSFNMVEGSVNINPHLDASWQHEFMDQSRGITSQFNNFGGGSFAVRTNSPSRDSALVDAGVNVDVCKTVTVFTDYMVQAGQDNYFGQSVQAGVKIGF